MVVIVWKCLRMVFMGAAPVQFSAMIKIDSLASDFKLGTPNGRLLTEVPQIADPGFRSFIDVVYSHPFVGLVCGCCYYHPIAAQMSVVYCSLFVSVLFAFDASGTSTTPAPSPAPGSFPFCGLCGTSSNYTIDAPGAIIHQEGFPSETCQAYYDQDQAGQINPGLCDLYRMAFDPCKCLYPTPPSVAPSAAPVAPTPAPVPTTVAPTTSSPTIMITPFPTTSAPVPTSSSPVATQPPAPATNISAPVASPTGSTPLLGVTSGCNHWSRHYLISSLLLAVDVVVGIVISVL
jgi:hypothetical protein